jgi:cytochrome b
MLSYLKSILKFKIPHYLGHNPLGAAMVITLLMSITLLAFSGMVLIAGEGQGPLAATFLGTWGGGWMEKVHEFLANFTLLLVVVHVSGVVFSSFLDGENLVKAMVTGRKKVRSHWEDVIPPPARESESQVRAENRGSAISSTSHGQ